ncbi:histidine phosphatase family protein [Lysobacter sp. Hz 25]|uniref:histidine phosphatase family protein n=1 Tax=Lysobacter sp. Hz 25 TaxID=3383698 RepID=UPI0038D444B5
MAATIHLIRHGQAAFGAADYDELSALGRQQSCLLGAALAPLWRDGDRVVVGGMRRHRQTAQECLAAMRSACGNDGGLAGSSLAGSSDAGHFDPGPHTDPRWNEFDHREIVARHRPEYIDHERLVADLGAAVDPRRAFQSLFAAAMTRWSSGDHDPDYSETWPAFRQRCRDALQAAVDAAAGLSNVWVFTSGGPIAAVVQGLLDAPDAQALRLSWSLVNASVTQLHVARSGLRLSTFNGHAHLYARDDLITYR